MLALLPEIWFSGLNTWLLVIIAIVGMACVIKGADWLVEGAAGLAYRLGMPKVVIGATIVSLGTTSPEAAVSVLAAWQGNAGLALGNGVGSIIVDTGLIFGLGLLLAKLPADKFVLSRQGWCQAGSATLLAVICYVLYILQGDAARIGRPIGILLVALLVGYMLISIRWAKQHPQNEPFIAHEDVDGSFATGAEPPEPSRSAMALVGLGLLGLLIVIFAGDALVQSISIVTVRWGVPEVVVAATLVAFGTSLPELIVGITSIRKGHPELLVGNVIGADILNVLFVIGFSALAAPLNIIEPGTAAPAIFLQLHLPTMLIMLVLMRVYIFRAVRVGHFDNWMGWPLVILYAAYVVAQFVIAAPEVH